MGKIVLGRGNVKVLHGLEIPKAPGAYLVELEVDSSDGDAPPVQS